MQTNEQLLHDTGRLPIGLRLPVLLAGVFVLWVAAHIASSHFFDHDLAFHSTGESGSPVLGFLVTLGLGVFFVSVWFLRNRIAFDSGSGEVVIRHSGLFGRSQRRIPLAGATAVYVHCGKVLASPFWDIGIEFDDSRREWVTRVYAGVDDTARVISKNTKLPVVKV